MKFDKNSCSSSRVVLCVPTDKQTNVTMLIVDFLTLSLQPKM